MYAVFVLHKLNSRHVWHKNLSIDFYAEILLIFVTMYTVLRRSSSFLCNEKFTAMYRIFSSYWPFRSYAGFFSVNRPVYFYHHIQVFVLHTFLSSEIIWYKDGNFSFSVRICKFTEFVPRFFCRNISCAAVF